MDSLTIKKYFDLGDEVEVACPNAIYSGKILEFGDSVLVIESASGDSMIIAVDNILLCKKREDNIKQNQNVVPIQDESSDLLKEIISNFNEIYECCSIQENDMIPTNATVKEITPQGVVALTDDQITLTCNKSGFVGYSRENVAVGKRIFCSASPNQPGISYACLTEMSYGEMYERLLRAINTKPKPRAPIVYSVLHLLNGQYGNTITQQRKNIKDILRKMSENDKVIPISQYIQGGRNYTSSVTYSSSNSDGQLEKKENEEPFLSATCEIKKYYPKHHNGMAVDSNAENIRFRDAVVVDSDLQGSLFSCWNTPIPVICVYSKIGDKNIAKFITKPGYLSEIQTRIQRLKENGHTNLASDMAKYLEGMGYNSQLEIDLNIIESQELLKYSRRQRLIKNFNEAEKGFLELISRGYEYDAVVRDLATMYQEWQSAEKAIELIEKCLPRLEKKVKTYNVLSKLYQSIGDKEKAVAVMEKSLEIIPNTKANTKKRDKLQRRINNLKEGKVSNVEHDKSMLFSIEDIPSSFLRYEANNTPNEVLTYVKDKTLDDKWQFVNTRIGELKDSPDLPAYYLAKIQLLEERGESGASVPVRIALADYCKARARNFFNEGNETSARIYLLQGLAVSETREDLYYLLLLSLCTTSQEVLSRYNEHFTGFEDIFKTFALREEDDVFCVLLQMISKNTMLSHKLVCCLFESKALPWLSDELETDFTSLQSFIDVLGNKSKYVAEKLFSFDKMAGEILMESNPTAFGKLILGISFFSSKEIMGLDARHLSSLREVANLLIDIEKKNWRYEECEDICRNVSDIVDASLLEIERSPSPLSTLNLFPLLAKAKYMTDRIVNRKYVETLPQIIVESIDDARLVGEEVELQISISNEMGSSRANNGVFEIDSINGRDVSGLSLSSTIEGPLGGGDKHIAVFTIKSTLVNSDNIEIKYTFKYIDVRKAFRIKQGKLGLAINKGEDYEDFENPYMAHVKSNAVKDKSMFKGRDELIANICQFVLDDYKGYVLYGQKRSGKSSVLYHITQQLRDGHKAFAVEYTMGNNIVQDSESENESMANLFYTITSEIGRAIKEVDRDVYRESGCHIVRRQEFEDYPDKTFREYIDFYRDIIVEKLHYEQDKIVLIVDEFTYLYYHILEGRISPRIMEFWKGLVDSRVFSFVFAGQDAMPRFMDDFQNVFASMHPQELTYIDEKSARELIEEPIWNKQKNCSRYHPDAVDEIIKLTACSPFYIMILCSELVKYTRQRKRLPILVSDVDALAQRMICNESSISRRDFDNLISCGESRLDIIDKDDSLMVLKDIARKSRHMDYYDINAIDVFESNKVRTIIDDLLRRGVLEPHPEFPNKVKIKVGLFKRWLLNHE